MSQKVIARYYSASDDFLPLRGSHNIYPKNQRSGAQKLLARELWKGQMLDRVDAPVTARHMRPACIASRLGYCSR